MTQAIYVSTAEYIEEINTLPVKRQVSVSGILKKLGVSRSGYHAWRKRAPSNTEMRRAALKEKIQEIYDESHQNYVPLKSQQNCKNPENMFLKKQSGIICVKWE